MSTTVVVTPRQALAAQIAVERSRTTGRPVSPAVRAIASAASAKAIQEPTSALKNGRSHRS